MEELAFARARQYGINRNLEFEEEEEEGRGVGETPLVSRCILPGSRFEGRQRSTYKVYNVCVTIQNVDLDHSTLCGYLSITALTEQYPVLTTFFEGEIVGKHYGFITRKWGADEVEDLSHWSKFPQFSDYAESFASGCKGDRNLYEEEVLFMRWKEHFLVPDHSVKSVPGASYDGFYYICFDRRTSTINGFYFHKSCEKFQSLQMKLVPQRTTSAFDFR